MQTRLFGCLFAALVAHTTLSVAQVPKKKVAVAENNAGLKLPQGFKALKVADSLGTARHIAVTPQGDLYIKMGNAKNGKGILHLKDTNGDGKAELLGGFGDYGGTGMAIKNGFLYASSNTEVFRYKLDAAGNVADPGHPEKIVTGLVDKGEHNSKSVVLDDKGNLYVNIGAPSNSCQEQDRVAGSKGQQPCPILEYAGGIWQFKADLPNQSYADGVRYATGIRNTVGLDWNTQVNELFLMQHGRDQLDMFPEYFSAKQNAEITAEVMFEITPNFNGGWPYVYYDYQQKKSILAPEYGGDGKKTDGTDKFNQPAIVFPAHMAPNGLLFYTGNQFPARYKNGAFVAFHGSWNRAPEKQAGYFVVFVPFKDGKPTGQWEVFADGFAGVAEVTSTRQAQHRPCGLAQGPDGSLYVTDDVKGSIYQITYKGK